MGMSLYGNGNGNDMGKASGQAQFLHSHSDSIMAECCVDKVDIVYEFRLGTMMRRSLEQGAESIFVINTRRGPQNV